METIKVWAQMFFDDGSVSQGKRIPAEWLDPQYAFKLKEIAESFLRDLNREEGWMLIWGAGNIDFEYYSTSSLAETSQQESDS